MALKNPFVESVEIRPTEQKLYYRLECDSSVYAVSGIATLSDARDAIIMLVGEEQVQVTQDTEITISYAGDYSNMHNPEITTYPVDFQELMNLSTDRKSGSTDSRAKTEKTLKKLRRDELVQLVLDQTNLLDQKESAHKARELELSRQIRLLEEKLAQASDEAGKNSNPGDGNDEKTA